MKCTTTQGFGANANPSYKAQGLRGHTGIDTVCGAGTPIYPKKRMYVYKVLDGIKQTANDGSGFTGVFGLDEQNNEWLYGHCDTIAKEGRWYETSDVIGYESNHGLVYVGSTQITAEMQKNGDKRGHHSHTQCRPTIPVKRTTGGRYLTTYLGGYLYKDGYREYMYPNNGYNGCIDWTQNGEDKQVLSLSDELAVIAARRQGNEEGGSVILWAFIKVLKSFKL